MAILVPILFATVLVVLLSVLVVFILLRACRLAVSETGQFSRDEEKQAAAKGLLYDGPTDQHTLSPADCLFQGSQPHVIHDKKIESEGRLDDRLVGSRVST